MAMPRGRRELIKGLIAEHLIADKGYDSDTIVAQAEGQARVPSRGVRVPARPGP
jgi:hypothetical protein